MIDLITAPTTRILAGFPSSAQGLRGGIWGRMPANTVPAPKHVSPRVMQYPLDADRTATVISLPGPIRMALMPAQKEPSATAFALRFDGDACAVVWGEACRRGKLVSPGAIAGRILREGLEACSDLEGSFLLLRVDSRQRHVAVLTDYVASRPFFYASTADGVFWGSSARGVSHMLPGGRVLEKRFLLTLATWGFLPGSQTAYRNVYRTPPSTSVRLRPGSVRTEAWSTHQYCHEAGSDSAGQFDRQSLQVRVAESVRQQLAGKQKIGVLLSGGVDSRVLLGEVHRLGIPAQALTWTTRQTRRLRESDVEVAARVAARVGVEHQIFEYDPIEALDSDRFLQAADGGCLDLGFPEYSEVLPEVGRHFDTIVRGDECLGWAERRKYFRQRVLRRLGLPPCQAIPGLAECLSATELRTASQHNRDLIRLCWRAARRTSRNLIDVMDSIYFHARQFGYLRISSYARMEQFCEVNPLLGRAVLEGMARTTPAMRVGKSLFQQYARSRFPALFEIPLARHPNLPDWTRLAAEDDRFRDVIQGRLCAARKSLADVIRWKKRVDLLGLLELGRPNAREASRRLPTRTWWRRVYHRVDQRICGPLHVGGAELAMRFVALARIVDDAADVCG